MNEDTMYQDEEDEAGEPRFKKSLNLGTTNYLNRASLLNNGNWPSSRIIRVSRASGGKDRHSKVLTSKGLRDRRVRLSVGTAIQFYDLQDRLGYDQPSKAVEWLLKAASSSIDELPQISSPFLFDKQNDHQMMIISDNEKSSSNHKSDLQMDIMDNVSYNNSTDQSHKVINNRINKVGSGLSLSRSDSRIRARERAKERAADQTKVNEKKAGNCNKNHDDYFHQLLVNPNTHVSRTTSFTELLSGAMNNTNGFDCNYYNQNRQWDHNYFSTHHGLIMAQQNRVCSNMTTSDQNPNLEMQQHLSSSAFAPPADPINVQADIGRCNESYNLINFEISSSSSSGAINSSSSMGHSTSGFNRGTLQSNSSSPSPLTSQFNFVPQLLPHQRFDSQDGFFHR